MQKHMLLLRDTNPATSRSVALQALIPRDIGGFAAGEHARLVVAAENVKFPDGIRSGAPCLRAGLGVSDACKAACSSVKREKPLALVDRVDAVRGARVRVLQPDLFVGVDGRA